MNRSALNSLWNQTRQKYGIYLRLLEAIPEDRLHDNIIPGMRTPVEIAAHTSSGIIRGFARGVARGEITNDNPDAEVVAKIRSRADLLDFARQCWKDADAAMATVGDDELTRMVKTPWNMEFPGSVAIHTMNDEFIHHRGQLYAFARAAGAEPPFVWSHDQNPAGFGPTA